MKKLIVWMSMVYIVFSWEPHKSVRAGNWDEWKERFFTEYVESSFTPPEGKTIQHLLGFAMTRAAQLRIASEKECSPSSMLNIAPKVWIANPVRRIPGGQHHRYTVQVFGTKEQEVYWQSSNPEVAQIDRVTGELTALEVGKTRVLVTDRHGRVLDAVWLNVREALPEEYEARLYPWGEYIFEGEPKAFEGNEFFPPHGDFYDGEFAQFRGDFFLTENTAAVMDWAIDYLPTQRELRIPASLRAMAYTNAYNDMVGFRHQRDETIFPVDGNNANYHSLLGTVYSYPFYWTVDRNSPYIVVRDIDLCYAACGHRALIDYPYKNKQSTYYVPYGVERIEGYAIDNRSLRKVVLPDTVTYIGEGGIHCSQAVVVIPASVTEFGCCEAIEENAVYAKLIITPHGSAAEEYAKQHKILYCTEEEYRVWKKTH